MNDFARVTIINSIQNLMQKKISLSLRKASLMLLLPQVVQLTALQIFHDNYKLLLLRQGKVIIQFNYALMLQLPQGFNLLRKQVRHALILLEVKNFYGHFLVGELIVSQIDRPETTFAKLLFLLDQLHSHLIIEGLTHGVKQILLALKRLHQIGIHQLHASFQAKQFDLAQ